MESHYSIDTVSRKDGGSAHAASSYQSGETRTDGRPADERGRKTYDIRDGDDDVLLNAVLTPGGAPEMTADELWTKAESKENRSDSLVARTMTLALPAELGVEGAIEVAEEYAERFVGRHQVGAEISVHRADAEDLNIHAHILFTRRRMDEDGNLAADTSEFNKYRGDTVKINGKDVKGGKLFSELRVEYAELMNEKLAKQVNPEHWSEDLWCDVRSLKDKYDVGREQAQALELKHDLAGFKKHHFYARPEDNPRKVTTANGNEITVSEHNRRVDEVVKPMEPTPNPNAPAGWKLAKETVENTDKIDLIRNKIAGIDGRLAEIRSQMDLIRRRKMQVEKDKSQIRRDNTKLNAVIQTTEQLQEKQQTLANRGTIASSLAWLTGDKLAAEVEELAAATQKKAEEIDLPGGTPEGIKSQAESFIEQHKRTLKNDIAPELEKCETADKRLKSAVSELTEQKNTLENKMDDELDAQTDLNRSGSESQAGVGPEPAMEPG